MVVMCVCVWGGGVLGQQAGDGMGEPHSMFSDKRKALLLRSCCIAATGTATASI